MAILRDAARLCIMEPFARWKLSKGLEDQRTRRANGLPDGGSHGRTNGVDHAVRANGNALESPKKKERRMQRSVLRFAEQGWSVIYYTVQWCYGLVSVVKFGASDDSNEMLAVSSP
jgi:acyl-CoA-dependent ceramide synthase